MSTKSKFTIILVLTSLVGALVFGLLSYLDSRESLREAAFDELTAIRTARAQQVQEYFDSIGDEASVITENPTVRRALVEYREAFAQLETDASLDALPFEAELRDHYKDAVVPRLGPLFDKGEVDARTLMPRSRAGRYVQWRYLVEDPHEPGDSHDRPTTDSDTRYEAVHRNFHGSLEFIRDEFDYYDIILIDATTGDIVHSARKEVDFGTNIYDGPWRASGLAELVDTVKRDPTRRAVHQTDTVFYIPSGGRPAVFVGSSIYEGDEIAGILALQLTNEPLNRILTAGGNWKDVGLKTTGETYLVGADGLLRTESRFLLEDKPGYLDVLQGTSTPESSIRAIDERGTSILLQEIDTEASRDALLGRTDTRVVDDYRGERVLSAYQPLRIDGRDYALLAEIDASEAFAPVRDLSIRMLVTTAIVLPLTALLGIWVSGLLMRPTRQMRNTARAFAGGDDDVQFAHEGSDEWGQLGQALNGVLDISRERLASARTARGETSDMIARLMPTAIGERYTEGERNITSAAPEATVASITLVSDPAMADLADPARSRELYEALDDMLEDIAARDGVDVLNQAGLNYVAFSGLTSELTNHAERVFRFLESFRASLASFNDTHGLDIRAKAGVATAPMFGALVGNYSAAYEIWGEAVVQAVDLAHAVGTGDLALASRSEAVVGRADITQAATVQPVQTREEPPVTGVRIPGFLHP